MRIAGEGGARAQGFRVTTAKHTHAHKSACAWRDLVSEGLVGGGGRVQGARGHARDRGGTFLVICLISFIIFRQLVFIFLLEGPSKKTLVRFFLPFKDNV